jgi:hypothetical protein
MSMGLGGDSPADLPRYLEGMDFPAGRMALIHHARQHHADPEMMRRLEQIADDQYDSLEEVVEEYSRH